MENNKPGDAYIEEMAKSYWLSKGPDASRITNVDMYRAGFDRCWNTHVVPLQEEIMRQGDTIVSLGKVLLKPNEREQLIKLESENKSLQEKLKIAEHLKELDDDAIVTLQKEVERLKSEVLKEKFPENLDV